MARSDLLVHLVKSGVTGDKGNFTKIVEAVIAEERAKQHRVLAEKLESIIRTESYSKQLISNNTIIDNKISSLIHETIPQKSIDELVLTEEIKTIFKEFIEEHQRCDLLRSYNLEPRNRILLTGSPGNGKTSLAEGIAESLMIPLLVVRYEGVVGSYLGETAHRLKRIIEYASTRKCVLFFDEFETLGKERGDTHETGEIKRLVSSLLLQIDSLPSHVIVVGATNHPELLDRAVWRRFQIRVELCKPTQKMIATWFKLFQQNIKSSLGYAPSILAKNLLGTSFSEIEEFGLTIFRKYVLGLPNSNMKSIVSNTLKQWNKKIQISSDRE